MVRYVCMVVQHAAILCDTEQVTQPGSRAPA